MELPWNEIDDVLLDMDGTLLDRHFDNFFFEKELPRRYAVLHRIPVPEAQKRLFDLYRAEEGTLNWTDLDYWTRALGIDVVALTKEFEHMIQYHPDAEDFLRRLGSLGKRAHLVTNAHSSGLAIKLAKTGVDRYLKRVVNAFDTGALKMRSEFWPVCQRLIGFDPKRALYIDDDESCLEAAERFGIGYILHRSKSSSELPPEASARFSSIETFQSILPS